MVPVRKVLVPVDIRLLCDWMGHPKGSTLRVWEDVGRVLIDRGAAEYLMDKSLDEPPSHKMVERPERKKSFARVSTRRGHER